MSRAADSAFPEVADEFDAPLYPDGQLEAIRDNLGKSRFIAMQELLEGEGCAALDTARHDDEVTMARPVKVRRGTRMDRPTAVTTFKTNVGNALQRFHDLNEMAEHKGQEWQVLSPITNKRHPGFPGTADYINWWLKRQELFRERKAADPEGKGFHPEMWTIRDGAPVWSGRGTHSGRVRYPLVLVPMGARSYEDFTQLIKPEDNSTDPGESEGPELTLDAIVTERGYPCPVKGCGHVSEFDPDSQISQNAAERGLAVHMGKPKGKFKVEEHRDMKERLFA